MKLLKHIKFPVYPIPNSGTISKNGWQLIYTTRTGTVYVIDDISLGGTFARRRLLCEDRLLPLKKAVLSVGSLVLYSNYYKTFIDSNGKLFKYRKMHFAPVVLKIVRKCIPYKSGSVLLLDDVHCPIMFYRQLRPNEHYAILAIVENGYIMLGASSKNYLRRNRIKI